MSMGAVGDEFSEINVTPLTDVFLVLLVIMIIIAPLIDKSDLEIKPPDAVNAKKPDDQGGSVTVDIDKKGQMAVNGQLADATTLPALLDKTIKKYGTPENVAIFVNADGDTKDKDVMTVMSAASSLGVKKMRIFTIEKQQ